MILCVTQSPGEVVGAYLAPAGEGYAMQILHRRVAATARASGAAGHPLDTNHPVIRETLRGLGRTHGNRGRRAAALTAAELERLSQACDFGLAVLRDQALLLRDFAGAPRRSELVALDVELRYQGPRDDDGLRGLTGR